MLAKNRSCQLSQSERLLQVLVWDVSTGTLLAELRGGHGAAAGIRCIRLSPDGRTLASATGGGPSSVATGDGRVNVWSWRTGFLIASVRLKVSAVHAVLFSNDGAVIVRLRLFMRSIDYCAWKAWAGMRRFMLE